MSVLAFLYSHFPLHHSLIFYNLFYNLSHYCFHFFLFQSFLFQYLFFHSLSYAFYISVLANVCTFFFICSFSFASFTNFLLSFLEIITLLVSFFFVSVFSFPKKVFSPVGTSTFLYCFLALTSISTSIFSTYALTSFRLKFKSFSRKVISFSRVCFLNLAVSICSRLEPFSPRSNSKPCFCICSGNLSCSHNSS